MWKKSMVIIGGVALAVSLPLAVLAMTTDDSVTDSDTNSVAAVGTLYQDGYWDSVAAEIQVQEQVQVQDQVQPQDQVMTRRQLRVHIETGPPEGFEPIQQRLHKHDQLGMGNTGTPMGNSGAPRGNPDAPMHGNGTGDCLMDGTQGTGDCLMDGRPSGSTSRGPGNRSNR
jgi:hypothetical protein